MLSSFRLATIPGLCVLALSLSLPAGAQDCALKAPNLVAQPGDVVSIPILFDNSGGPVQGWSFGVRAPSPLTIVAAYNGSTTAAFNAGAGPDFGSLNVYPGVGVTAGVVIDFQGMETLPAGSNFELHVIDVQIPSNATPGTSYPLQFVANIGSPPVAIVIVRNGQSNWADLQHGTITVGGTNYCGPAVSNSSGLPASISAQGVFYAGGYPLSLTTSQLPLNQFGYFLVSQTQGFIPGPGGSQGNLCLGGKIGRFSSQVQYSGSSGSFSIAVNTLALPLSPPVAAMPGETWHFTTWFRDKNPTPTSNFSDAVSIYFH
jgi:hypothetical protein